MAKNAPITLNNLTDSTYHQQHYIETGAFVISKYRIISNKTRIGEKVDIFEVSLDEAIDIDNFHINVFYNIDNIAEHMVECDVAITSRGRMAYELALLGIPTICIAQNSREKQHGFICNENGFTYIRFNPPDKKLETYLQMYLKLSQYCRERFQNTLLAHDLRSGRKRVMSLINGL